MKNIKIKLLHLLNIAISIFVTVFLFQITIAEKFSFSNEPIDHFFHFTENYILAIFILLLLIKIFFLVKNRWLKLISALLSFPVALFVLISTIFAFGVVFSNDRGNMRHYLYEKDNYKYYLVSERFWAFEGSANLAYYKEKPIFWFVKHQIKVNEEELKNEGINLQIVTTEFYKKYLR